MNTEELSIFVVVVREGSFAAAARRLARNPSAISRSIAQLERRLGARLFQRTTRRLTLTEAGRRALARIEPLVEELDALPSVLSDQDREPEGTLVITTSVAFGQLRIVPLIADFLSRYPAIVLDLKFTDKQLDLVADGIDIGLRLGASLDGSFVGRRLRDTRYHVCASPAWLASNDYAPEPDAASGQAALCMDLPGYRERWHLRRPSGERKSIEVVPRLLSTSALTLRDAALAGLGPALLADWLVSDVLEDGSLVDLYPDWEASAGNFDTGLWLLYPSRKFVPRRTRVAIDYLSDALT